MQVELELNPQLSGSGKVYEVTHGQNRVGRIWERPASINPANKWGWIVIETSARRFGAVVLPSRNAATIDDAKAQIEAAFLGLVSSHTGPVEHD
jgi:hypothetical protein